MFFRNVFIVVALAVLVATPALAVEQEITLVGRKVAYWPPAGSEVGKAPLIIFSHGFKGCATQSRFLMEALAADGYWVFAPTHQDAACDGGGGGLFQRPEESFRKPEQWTDATYADRGQDIRVVLSAIKQQPQFAPRIDFTRVGLLGHSLGGYTVLALAGAWPTWNMPGIKAVVALSPYTRPFNEKRTLAGLKVPVMYQGGTRDNSITPFLREPGGSYDQSPAPKYYVEFTGAGHFAWTNLGWDAKPHIASWTVAFLNQYVKGQADAFHPTQDGVSDARMETTASNAQPAPPPQPLETLPIQPVPLDQAPPAPHLLEAPAPAPQKRMEVLSVE